VKILNYKNLIKFFLTFFNVVKIFFITYSKFQKNKSIKFFFFYFPVKAYQENIIELAKSIDKKKNVDLYLVYNSFTSAEIKNKKKSIFIDFNYIKFIPFRNFFLGKINFLISSYVIYTYFPNTKNIYINHDIYDTPMVNKEIEKKLFIELSKLDYIFVSSEISKKYFIKSFNKYAKDKKFKISKIINTGYLKLDHVFKKLNKIKRKNNYILVAPTASNHYKNINLSNQLTGLINFLLIKKNKVIYRPHPMDLTKKGNLFLVKLIINKFKNFENFEIDLSPSYLNSYAKSWVLITDFSGTAYTYSFSSDKPVIFFNSKVKNNLSKDLKKLYYFMDRKMIGYIVSNFIELDKKLKIINKNKLIFKSRIKKLRKKRIIFFRNSLNKSKREISKLI